MHPVDKVNALGIDTPQVCHHVHVAFYLVAVARLDRVPVGPVPRHWIPDLE